MVRPESASISRSMRAKSSLPCDQIFGRLASNSAAERNSSFSSAATMTCFGAAISRQCASDAPRRLVLISDTTPPTDVMPSQIARYSGRFGIISATASPLREILRQRPARVAIGALDERAVGQRLARRDQGWRSAAGRCNFLDDIEKDAPRIAGDRRRRLERADPILQRAVLAAGARRWLISLVQSHAR